MKYLDGYPELDLLSSALSFTTPSVRVSTRIEAYSCKAINREKRLFKTLEQDIKSDLELSTSISPPDQHTAIVQSAFGPLNQAGSRKTLWLLIATLNLAFPDHDFSRVNAEEFIKEDSARTVLSSLSNALNSVRASSQNSGSGTTSTIGADPAYRSSLFASYPPGMASLPGYNPLQPSAKKRGGKRTTADAIETYGSAPTSSKKKDGKAGRSIFAPQAPPMSGSAAFVNHLKNDLDSVSNLPAHPFLRQVLEPVIELGECEVFSYTPDLESDPHAYDSDEEEEAYTSEEETFEGAYREAYEDMEASQAFDGEHELGWDMDGVLSTPSGSVPPTPSGRKRTRRRSSTVSRAKSGQDAFSRNMMLWDSEACMPRQDQTDDESGGLLWSSNYFLYNKKMKRILFISCWGRKIGGSPAPISLPLPPVQQKIPFGRRVSKPPGPQTFQLVEGAAAIASAHKAPRPAARATPFSIFGGDLPPMIREVGVSPPKRLSSNIQ